MASVMRMLLMVAAYLALMANVAKAGLNKDHPIFELARFVDPTGTRNFFIHPDKKYFLKRDIYLLSPDIVNYLIKKLKDNREALQDYRSEWLLGSKRDKFDELYEKYVTNTCSDWIDATYHSNRMATNKKVSFNHASTEDDDRRLRYRRMCQAINVSFGYKALREQVHREFQQKLASMIIFAKANPIKGDSCWVQEYEDLREKYHKHEEYVKLVDYLVEHFKSPNCNKFQSIRNDLELVQRTHQMDLLLCEEMTLDMLFTLRKRYGVSFGYHLESQMKRLITACRKHEFNELSAKLNQKNGKHKRLGEIFELVRFVDPDGTDNFFVYSKEFFLGRDMYKMSPGIVDYIIKKSKDDKELLQEYLFKPSLGSMRERFDKLYKKYVTDTCSNWISATDNLSTWESYDRVKYDYVPTKDETRWLDFRRMCKNIHFGPGQLRELVYREIQGKSPRF